MEMRIPPSLAVTALLGMAGRPDYTSAPVRGYSDEWESDPEQVERVKETAEQRRRGRNMIRLANHLRSASRPWSPKPSNTAPYVPREFTYVRRYERQKDGSLRVLNKPVSRRKKRILEFRRPATV